MKRTVLMILALTALALCCGVAQADRGQPNEYYLAVGLYDLSSDGTYSSCNNSSGLLLMPLIQQDGADPGPFHGHVQGGDWDEEDAQRWYKDEPMYEWQQWASSYYTQFFNDEQLQELHCSWGFPTELICHGTWNNFDKGIFIKNRNATYISKIRFVVKISTDRVHWTEIGNWTETTIAGGTWSMDKYINSSLYPTVSRIDEIEGVDEVWIPLPGETANTAQYTSILCDQYGAEWYQRGVNTTYSLLDAPEGVRIDQSGQLTVTSTVLETVSRPMDYPFRIRALGPNGSVCEKEVTLRWPAPSQFGDGTATAPWLIQNESNWNRLSAFVASGEVNSGMHFRLTEDISVTEMVGSADHPFTGVFDGAGHTLTVNYTSNGDYTAPFRQMRDATVKNLCVKGTISTSSRFAAGITGNARGRGTILNCRSSVTINSSVSGDGTHGGLVARLNNDSSVLNMEGCVFDGSIKGTATTLCGGLIGWGRGTVTVQNCVFDPDSFDPTGSNFARGTATIRNCYYTHTLNTQGKRARAVNAGEGVTIDFGTAGAVYSQSGITAYSVGLKYGDVFYAGSGDTVTLGLSCQPPAGCAAMYTANEDILTETNGAYKLIMPDKKVTINALFIPAGAGTAEDPWLISTAALWDTLASAIERGVETSGKHIVLTANISVATMLGTQENPFAGTFDGAGHTLTFNSESHPELTAPFRYTNGVDIRNLYVEGSITGRASRSSGLIGENSGSSTVTNCRISASLAGNWLVGGFCIGTGDALSITGCVFDGQITGKPTQSGCFVAWGTSGLSITDSLSAPRSGCDFIGGAFCFEAEGAPTLTNCYYLPSPGDAQGKQALSVAADKGVTIGFGQSTATYNVSGVTSYAAGLKFDNAFYAGEGDSVSLSLPYEASQGFIVQYTSSAGTLTKGNVGYTLIMPDEDVTISAMFASDLDGSGTQADPWKIVTGLRLTAMPAGWYKVTGSATFSERVDVIGTVRLNLGAGTTLTAAQGVNVSSGNSLAISGSGALNAVGCEGCAGIGGGIGESCGSVTIDGGTVNATGSIWGAGIGGGKGGGNGGNITINGGHVTARCYDPDNAEIGLAAGIGGGDTGSGGTILITGGTVYARGGRGGAGIGGGGYGSGGSITITGGTVTAVGSSYPNGRSGAGIGAGRAPNSATSGDSGNITIAGGTVIAIGGANAQAIGVSNEVAANDSGTLKLGSGLTVKAGDSESTAVVATGDLAAACRSPWVRIDILPDFGTPDFTLPSFLTTVEEEAFEGAAMRIVLIPNGCTSIGAHAFRGCPNLQKIRIPAGCAIGTDAFDGCALVYLYGAAGSPAEAYCQTHANCVFVEEAQD